jgi:hypothetical protein
MHVLIANCFVCGFAFSAVLYFTGYCVRFLNVLLER